MKGILLCPEYKKVNKCLITRESSSCDGRGITSNSKSMRSWVATPSVRQVFALLDTRNMMNGACCILVTSQVSLKLNAFLHRSASNESSNLM